MKNLKRYIQFFIMCYMIYVFIATLMDGLFQYLFPESTLATGTTVVKKFVMAIPYSAFFILYGIIYKKIFKTNGKYPPPFNNLELYESGYPQGKALPEPDGKTPRIVLYLIMFCTFFFMVGIVSTFVDLIDCLRNVPCRFANVTDRLLWMLYFDVGIMLCLIAFRPMGIAVLKIFENADRKERQIKKYLAEQKAARKRAQKNHKQGILTTQ